MHIATPNEKQKRVDNTIAGAKDAETKIRQAADAARKATATFAIFTALSLHGRHFPPFQAGQVHLRDVFYYLAVIYFALFSATRVMEARRWR